MATAVSARRPAAEIEVLIGRYQDAIRPPETEAELELAWEGIVARRLTSAPRMKVFRALNERLGGGLLPGHNVTVFGLVESGKSALALTLATGFAKRGHKVLYVGNEDPAPDLMVRAIQMTARKSREELMARPEEAERAALAEGVGNLYIRELAPGTLAEIERLVRKYSPAVLVVDQLRNIHATKLDNYTQRLDAIAQGIRAIGKRYGLVTIGVTQAGDSARGRSVLDAGDVDSSNVGIPGAADVLIGIGSTEQLQRAGLRTLSLAKNKVSFRHENFTVRVCPNTGRMMSHD
jgi:KaiC/GvpD/RAD55 family RecA-like ATPase